ncbi:MAG: bifunctional phosphopantothenoylcysteine decarboxylase/phosphopantothenate synthase [Arcanobacterium sp.]|nr:bifunctional phosphopantothenoylcysteine decarboxylase/phosphopantothenate synthase [Arcanobacterium sp.]
MNSAESYRGSGSSPTVVLGITGGIAAYKSAAVVRGLRAAGCSVRVVPTPAALTMVGRTTWEALSGHPVYTEVNDAADEVTHVRTGSEADLLLIAPATANTLAKLAVGIADNLLTATALVATCPLLLAPAMHTQMWENPATQANIATLRSRGATFVGPDTGRLTGADSGMGRMSEPSTIVARAVDMLTAQGWNMTATAADAIGRGANAQPAAPVAHGLSGLRVLISAGGTHEPIDPVRFIGNRSTGRMGVAVANAALARGGDVVVVGANLESAVLAQLSSQIEVHSVVTAQELFERMRELSTHADVIVMAAAVADFRPVLRATHKIKKDGSGSQVLELEENPDILAYLANHRSHPEQLVVGFAAETGDSAHSALEYGKAKAARKGADAIVVNEVGERKGFGAVRTDVTIVDIHGGELAKAAGTKEEVGAAVADYLGQAARARSAHFAHSERSE